MNEKQHSGQIFRELRDRRKHMRHLKRKHQRQTGDTSAALPPGLGDDVEAPVDPTPDRKSLEGFRAFAWPHLVQSHGQVFQDLWLLYELGIREGGYFVEFGAADGSTFSNTLMLERDLGWNGILSEPFPHFHEHIRAVRNCHFTDKAVYSESGRTLEFAGAERAMFSRLEAPGTDETTAHDIDVVARFPVETISLDDLLDAHDAPEVIDYISVDTEGTELQIMQAFDFTRRHVRAFSVEHNHTVMQQELDALLGAHGYVRRFPFLSRFDGWYLHESERREG